MLAAPRRCAPHELLQKERPELHLQSVLPGYALQCRWTPLLRAYRSTCRDHGRECSRVRSLEPIGSVRWSKFSEPRLRFSLTAFRQEHLGSWIRLGGLRTGCLRDRRLGSPQGVVHECLPEPTFGLVECPRRLVWKPKSSVSVGNRRR
jgi:hypothetical protein